MMQSITTDILQNPGYIERIVWSAMIWAADNNPCFDGVPEYTDGGDSFAETECRAAAKRIRSAFSDMLAAEKAARVAAQSDAAAARRRVRELVGEVAHQAAKVPQTIEACDHLLSDMEARAEAVEARAAKAEAEMDALLEEASALAAGQCLFPDGTGLTGDEYGNQICAMKARAEAAEAQVAELRAENARLTEALSNTRRAILRLQDDWNEKSGWHTVTAFAATYAEDHMPDAALEAKP
jgi:uncharacterized phage infection (PIP) family protein YhgE